MLINLFRELPATAKAVVTVWTIFMMATVGHQAAVEQAAGTAQLPLAADVALLLVGAAVTFVVTLNLAATVCGLND